MKMLSRMLVGAYDCIEACSACADSCDICATKLRRTFTDHQLIMAVEECREACDRTIASIRSGKSDVCGECATYCAACAAALRTYADADYFWCVEMCKLCAEACLAFAAERGAVVPPVWARRASMTS